MSEEKSFIPALTLEPNAAQTEAAVEEAPVEEKQAEQTPVEKLDISSLSPAEQAAVRDFSEKIDIKNTDQIMNYGSAAQKNISEFSDAALSSVKTKDLGECGDMLSELVVELKGLNFDEEEKKGFLGLFKKASQTIAEKKAQFDKAEVNVDKIAKTLEGHQVQLMKDAATLDKLYELNLTYFKELTMYILAGKKKLNEVRGTELPALMDKAHKTGLPEDAQAVNDMASLCNRFEKKIHDLELTRMISIQMAPQIRLVQNNDTLMSEKIQSTIVNTIPLWKSQMVLAIGINHSEQAARAQREVTDMTNELLRKNAEVLKTATIETAKESERGIVDMETLKITNESLITTLDEVVRIQTEGRQKRREAETELARMEGELKQKLLQLSN